LIDERKRIGKKRKREKFKLRVTSSVVVNDKDELTSLF